jgi:hypothetical protein
MGLGDHKGDAALAQAGHENAQGLTPPQLRDVVAQARAGQTRVRLSCVLLRGAVDSLDGIRRYLDF